MKKAGQIIFGAAGASMLLAGVASAASITNNDSSDYTLQITENGVRSEVTVGASQTVDVCSSSCFMTLPNGDLVALEGGEAVTISGGTAIIN